MEPSQEVPALSPPTLLDRLSVFLRILHKYLGWLATVLVGGGWTMVFAHTNIPIGITLLGAGMFFGIWWLLKEANVTNKYLIPTLLIYLFIAIPTGAGLSWWLTVPPIAKTVTLHNINTSDWDKFLGMPNLKGTPIIELIWPPVIEATFEKDKLYGFLFQIRHNEYGMTITGSDFYLYPPKELEIDKNLNWTTIVNPAFRYLTNNYLSIDQEVPATLPVFRFKATQPGSYLFRYEIRGYAKDANNQYTPITVPGRFVVHLHMATRPQHVESK